MSALRHVLLRSRPKIGSFFKDSCRGEPSLTYFGRRFLFSKDFLGLDNYERQRLATLDRLGDLREKFCSRMQSYVSENSTETVFTDDLKTMLHLAKTHEDQNTAIKMYRRYLDQVNDLPVGEFNFGPVILRMLYYLDKPQDSYNLFVDESLGDTFDNMSCFIILLDQLYEQKDYEKVLKVFEIVQKKELRGIKYPNDATTTALAACYKLNTEDTLNVMLSIFRGCRERGIFLTPRSVSFAAYLALNQNRPDIALEVLVSRNDEKIYTSINLKAIAYSKLGRIEDAFRLLLNIVNRDVPQGYRRGNEVFQDTLVEVEKALKETDSAELSRQFEQIVQRLSNGGHISEKGLDEFICQPIVKQRQLQSSFKSRPRSRPFEYPKLQREGLTDMN